MRRTLNQLLNSGQLQKACVMMLKKKTGGFAFYEKSLLKCINTTTCKEFAECFYSEIFSSWRHSHRKKSSP